MLSATISRLLLHEQTSNTKYAIFYMGLKVQKDKNFSCSMFNNILNCEIDCLATSLAEFKVMKLGAWDPLTILY